MAAGLGFKTFTTGEVLTAGDVNGYLMQGVLVFATAAARNSAITSPQEGQFAFTKDTNGLWYYDGAAWVASGATGDIEGVTAGVGITGGGTSGTVTVTNDMATTITTAGDLIKGTGSGTYNRLGIGSTGQVLTVASGAPSWATPATSGMTLISATTFSGQSSQAFDAKFTSTYDVYLVFVSMYDNGVSADIKIQGRDSSNATIATGYTYAQNNLKYDGTASTNLGTGATSVNMGANGFSSTISQSMKFTFVKPLTTRVGFFWEGYSAGINGIINGAGQQTTTAFSGFILTPASSTISGTVYIYGLAK